jgi:hypothetical protein
VTGAPHCPPDHPWSLSPGPQQARGAGITAAQVAHAYSVGVASCTTPRLQGTKMDSVEATASWAPAPRAHPRALPVSASPEDVSDTLERPPLSRAALPRPHAALGFPPPPRLQGDPGMGSGPGAGGDPTLTERVVASSGMPATLRVERRTRGLTDAGREARGANELLLECRPPRPACAFGTLRSHLPAQTEWSTERGREHRFHQPRGGHAHVGGASEPSRARTWDSPSGTSPRFPCWWPVLSQSEPVAPQHLLVPCSPNGAGPP